MDYFHLKQENITITHTIMFHICTFNVKISRNRLLLLVCFYGQREGSEGAQITLTFLTS